LNTPDYSQYTDTELIAQYKKTDNNAIVGYLFEKYTHLVFGVCMKYLKDEEEAKDAVMLIFEKLLVDLKKHEISKFSGWLHSVARNHCLMHLRSEKTLTEKQRELKKDLKTFVESDHQPHLNNVDDKEKQLSLMEEGIKTLKEDQRICVELFYLKEKSYQEIADHTGYSLNNVKSNIQNGKRNIKIYMTGQA
jgi:RNA polymerase sigma factor (sigma-70 family)